MKKIVLTSLATATLLLADDPTMGLNLGPDDKMTASVNFGYISTQGNTETTTYAADGKIKKGFSKHLFELSFDGQYASETDLITDVENETKNKYFVELEYNYEFTDRFAIGYLSGFTQDRFSSYDYQSYTGPGAKYKVIKSDIHNLTLEGNMLYARDKYKDLMPDKDTAINSYASLRVKGVYAWQVLENLGFTQELTYRTDVEDTELYFAYSKTELKSKISDMFSAGLSYKLDYVNIILPGMEHSDTTLTATLGIDY